MSNSDIHPIDLHVGSRVRTRRKSLDISQTELAVGLGLTFQQVQKYERGLNRISASKLFEISRALKAPIAYFFEGYQGPAVGEALDVTSSEQAVSNFLATAEGLELAECFTRLPSAALRRSLLDLARAMTADAQANAA
jgi:transcriptional regulator with XRE-family HTH domain